MSRNTQNRAGSDASDVSSESGWLDVEQDEEPQTIISLLDAQTFSNPKDMLKYCKEDLGFDFLDIVHRLGLDFYGAIKLVNFVRQSVQEGQVPSADQVSYEDINQDNYLKPVLENDAFLFNLDEILTPEHEDDSSGGPLAGSAEEDLLAQNKLLEAELERVRSQFSNFRLTVEETLDRRWGDDTEPGASGEVSEKSDSDYYFESYAAHGEPGKPLTRHTFDLITDLSVLCLQQKSMKLC